MISKQEVKHIAKLARIELEEKEIELFQKDFTSILDYFELLKKADTSKVKDIFSPLENYLKENVIRIDFPFSKNGGDKLISSFPQKKERYAKVKAILK